MFAGLPRRSPPRGPARSSPLARGLRRAVRVALMLGPLIGPLAASSSAGQFLPTKGTPADAWAVAANAAALLGPVTRPRLGGTEDWQRSGARFAAGRPAADPIAPAAPDANAVDGRRAAAVRVAVSPPVRRTPTRRTPTRRTPTRRTPTRRTPTNAGPTAPGRVELGWLTRQGLAVHPTRTAAVAALPRLPELAPAVVQAPALAAPAPRPVFAELVPPPAFAPAARTPLIAAKPAPPAVPPRPPVRPVPVRRTRAGRTDRGGRPAARRRRSPLTRGPGSPVESNRLLPPPSFLPAAVPP